MRVIMKVSSGWGPRGTVREVDDHIAKAFIASGKAQAVHGATPPIPDGRTHASASSREV